MTYWVAGLIGASVAAFWNFLTTAALTWGGNAPSTDKGRR
jgi:hypothetical protein